VRRRRWDSASTKAELKYGHNERLRRVAQEIVVSQQQEIAVMRLAIGEKLRASAASPMPPGATPSSITPDEATPHGAMNMRMGMKSEANVTRRVFIAGVFLVYPVVYALSLC
jgi:hypothetical protein